MGKVIVEVSETVDMKLKAQNISDAIKKLIQLKRANHKRKNILKGIKRFKGIAKYKDTKGSTDEWYHQ